MSIESVYQSLLRRSPDQGAYGTYAGWSDEDIANAIYGSQEFANIGGGDNMLTMPSDNLQPDVYAPSQPSGPITFQGGGADLNALYQQYLGRGVDPSGAATYAGWDTQSVINALTGSQEYKNRNQAGSISAPNLPSEPLGFGKFEMDQINAINKKQAIPNAYYNPEDYNFEMTGRPSDQELATNPATATAWYKYSGELPPPPVTSWETAPDFTKNTPRAISYYKDYGFEAPFDPAALKQTVDSKNIRIGYNNTPYAALPSNRPDLPSGGEYIVDQKTGKFLLDKGGNPIPVPTKPNTTSDGWFNDWGVLALPLLAAGGVAGLENLGILGGEGAAGGTATGTGLTSGAGGSTGLLGAAGDSSGISAYLSSIGLGDGVVGVPLTSIGLEGPIGAGSLAGILGSQTAAGLGGALAGIGGGLTASQLAAYEAAAAGAAPSLASTLGTGLTTASTLARLLGAGASLFGGSKSPGASAYLPSALRGTVPSTSPTGGVTPIQVGSGSNQSPLPGVYQEQFAPYVFGNQQPVQTPRGGGYDFMSALNKPLDTSVLGQMKNVTPTNNAQNQAQNAKLNFFSSLFA